MTATIGTSFRLLGLVLLLLLQACAGIQKGGPAVVFLADGRIVAGPDPERGEVRQALLSQFREWRGAPYRLGGTTKAGIDCSAFVQQTLAEYFSIVVPRSTAEQVHIGMPFTQGALQTGDLIFFRTGPNTRHVGFYLGGGEFLHASTTQGVTINRLDETYWRRTFWTVRRVL